ncbi:glucoamylase family protein [Alloacidobacterium sp.]|uniref:glucoamylase family protein n=1 Tax=Alloacidobacterium sp. TaxID=2951999 RepID=UPI002D64AD2A|nr:glucoamylase family protein [Alloacidobacterium sp.]HYK35327.1 glucoamylase family protein [Alloacidobacterium sp.]
MKFDGKSEAHIRKIVDSQGNGISRRQLLRQLASVSLVLPLAEWKSLPVSAQIPIQHRTASQFGETAPAPPPTALSPEDDQFLDDLERSNFLFFWEQANPETGLIKDRCNVRTADTSVAASIASTGFGLTAICIAEKRGFISHQDARLRVIATLSFVWKKLPTHRGFFYHFANMNTGERIWDSEVSSVDTAILLCGILTCRQHFKDRDIVQLSRAIFDRVDWKWLSQDITLLPMGWTPEFGFLPSKWDYYSELMMIYLLGMGSSSHPLPPEAWSAWKRMTFEYDGLRYIGSFAPLFVHQYSQAWFDFRHKRDEYANYFQNSATATEVHRRFCVELAKTFPDYSDDLWGITASDSLNGYVVWGGPPATGPIDGTVVPAATGGSLPFLTDATLLVLKNIKARYPQAWCRYGFVDAFNPLKKWYDNDVVGIDTGITMLMAENVRTSFVWDTFMKNPEAQRGMATAGFKLDNPAAPKS